MTQMEQTIENVRTMQQSYDELASAAEAYNVGKIQLAQAITNKGVETSPTESYPEMAEKVNAIAQETYEIDGGEMYAKQLFGNTENPCYWNLYEILEQLLSDGRLVSYGGILLAEYYRGYDSLALSGAGAGGAYVVSDKDENGLFKMYTEDTTHVWDTKWDGKADRWVAYCFADEYHNFEISDTNTSPRGIFIGRKIGEIKLLADVRTRYIVCPDGQELNVLNRNGKNFNWDRRTVIRAKRLSGDFFQNDKDIESLYVKTDVLQGALTRAVQISLVMNISSVILKCPDINYTYSSLVAQTAYGSETFPNFNTLIIDNAGGSCVVELGGYATGAYMKYLKTLVLVNFESATVYLSGRSGESASIPDAFNVYLGYESSQNDKTKSIVLSYQSGRQNGWERATSAELKNGWCKPLNIQRLTNLTKENVQSYIFDRLGVNDISTGTVTITLANSVLNLFTQEEINAVVARTNISIVGA